VKGCCLKRTSRSEAFFKFYGVANSLAIDLKPFSDGLLCVSTFDGQIKPLGSNAKLRHNRLTKLPIWIENDTPFHAQRPPTQKPIIRREFELLEKRSHDFRKDCIDEFRRVPPDIRPAQKGNGTIQGGIISSGVRRLAFGV
jgi:hypothetical protein